MKLTAVGTPKMDGWNTIVSFWGSAYFQVLCHVSFTECKKTLRGSKLYTSSPILRSIGQIYFVVLVDEGTQS